MISLRNRLALLLGAAIVGVVVLATVVTFQIVERPRRADFEDVFAQGVELALRLAQGSGERARAAGIEVGPKPDFTEIARPQTEALNLRLREDGVSEEVVIGTHGEGRFDIAVPLADGQWMRLRTLGRPPSPLGPLVAYLSLVTLGALAVALFAARRITGPLRVLEEAAASVRADGTLPRLEPGGPAEIRATASALNRLSERLRLATESRMRLVAAAGHDLRTPMTRMRLRAEFLPEEERQGWLKDLSELDEIADSAIRLVREEVAEEGREPVALRPLLAEIAEELGAIGRRVRLEPGVEGEVPGQRLALKRALRNLAENAATHGGGATLRLEAEEQGQGLRVLVEDHGPGIPQDMLGQVFEPFFRVDAGRRKTHGGAGLGLAIAREILERHGGTIRIENRAGGGLRQTVDLPGA
ncbi:ATP-binding protein [Aureimonas sp. AU40]|uniref:ATP-binding protein n=1 Tax=Aureimonas sp. AU40 TaxID=1637747 RepID=UPI0007825820|nr:ATP-binding protein [Aureimonas sp. AU40]